MTRHVLFLCTGNYYRSRFAEFVFNAICRERGLDWRAESRGLALEKAAGLPGPMSPLTFSALEERGLTPRPPVRYPQQCCDEDLAGADLVIALKEAEHRPYLQSRFPDWPDRVRYWHVHDLDGAEPQEAMDQIDRLVRELVDGLLSGEGRE